MHAFPSFLKASFDPKGVHTRVFVYDSKEQNLRAEMMLKKKKGKLKLHYSNFPNK
jgi:hypothetical protein